jgi:hypothetical protein
VKERRRRIDEQRAEKRRIFREAALKGSAGREHGHGLRTPLLRAQLESDFGSAL